MDRYYPRFDDRRRLICLKCIQMFLSAEFPHRCPYCHALSSWLIGVPFHDLTLRRMVERLKVDKRRAGLLAP